MLFAIASASWLGCDDLADSETGPQTLAVLQGTLSAVPQSESPVAMAIAWDVTYASVLLLPELDSEYWDEWVEYNFELTDEFYPVQECVEAEAQPKRFDGTPWQARLECESTQPKLQELAEVVSYEPKFPLEFRIPIQRLPPDVARLDLSRLGGEGTFAMASVLAFADSDADGKLDPGRPGVASEEPLATSMGIPKPVPGNDRAFTHFFLVYLDGRINVSTRHEGYRDALAAIPQGFSIWHAKLEPGDDPFDLERSAVIQPVDTKVELAGDPALATSGLYCERTHETIRYVDKPFASASEDALSACGLDEENDAWSVEWTGETVSIGPCQYETEAAQYGVRVVDPESVPDGWPCPVE